MVLHRHRILGKVSASVFSIPFFLPSLDEYFGGVRAGNQSCGIVVMGDMLDGDWLMAAGVGFGVEMVS